MAKADRIKEEIAWLKLLFGLLAAIEIPLVAWLAKNYETAERILALAAAVIALLAGGSMLICAWLIRRRIARLEEI